MRPLLQASPGAAQTQGGFQLLVGVGLPAHLRRGPEPPPHKVPNIDRSQASLAVKGPPMPRRFKLIPARPHRSGLVRDHLADDTRDVVELRLPFHMSTDSPVHLIHDFASTTAAVGLYDCKSSFGSE